MGDAGTMDDPARRHQQLQAELGQIGLALPGSLTLEARHFRGQ